MQCKRLNHCPWSCRQGADVPLYNSSIVLGPMTALSKNYFSYLPSANPSWSELQNSFWKLGHSLGNVQQIWSSFQSKLQPGVRFYLTVLLTIAAANSLFILVSYPISTLEETAKAMTKEIPPQIIASAVFHEMPL